MHRNCVATLEVWGLDNANATGDVMINRADVFEVTAEYSVETI